MSTESGSERTRSDPPPTACRGTHHFLNVLSWVTTHCGLAIGGSGSEGYGDLGSGSGSGGEESAGRKRLCEVDCTSSRRVEAVGVDGDSGESEALSFSEVGFSELWS